MFLCFTRCCLLGVVSPKCCIKWQIVSGQPVGCIYRWLVVFTSFAAVTPLLSDRKEHCIVTGAIKSSLHFIPHLGTDVLWLTESFFFSSSLAPCIMWGYEIAFSLCLQDDPAGLSLVGPEPPVAFPAVGLGVSLPQEGRALLRPHSRRGVCPWSAEPSLSLTSHCVVVTQDKYSLTGRDQRTF